MATEDQPVRIIANESNTVFEIEGSEKKHTQEPATNAEKATVAQLAEHGTGTAERRNDEIATNDGAVVETLDTAFHNRPGVAEGEPLSGSSRADYYEARSQGKTDAEEELDALNNNEAQ